MLKTRDPYISLLPPTYSTNCWPPPQPISWYSNIHRNSRWGLTGGISRITPWSRHHGGESRIFAMRPRPVEWSWNRTSSRVLSVKHKTIVSYSLGSIISWMDHLHSNLPYNLKKALLQYKIKVCLNCWSVDILAFQYQLYILFILTTRSKDVSSTRYTKK